MAQSKKQINRRASYYDQEKDYVIPQNDEDYHFMVRNISY